MKTTIYLSRKQIIKYYLTHKFIIQFTSDVLQGECLLLSLHVCVSLSMLLLT